ncbi:innexin inx2-like [Trichogramma pretiosum]|uniref:innexin inx2-like n=1 Tax=Trichogramma pretiosum TaxID=7493 RepID=UPI0006C9884C|nr:innexin inx2-like [Trichogramma pretiosum]
MFELLGPVRDLLAGQHQQQQQQQQQQAAANRPYPLRIDNVSFRLHTQLSFALLACCAALVSAKQFFGEPIVCINHSGLETESVNIYCWIYGTFTVKRHLRGVTGRQVAAPGVAQASDGDEIYQHKYYQWVCLVLLLQGLAYYVSGALWRAWEAGLMCQLSNELEVKSRVCAYFAEARLSRAHELYALRFASCELLNFLLTLGQFCLLDKFLEGRFASYGLDALSFLLSQPEASSLRQRYQPSSRVDPMARLFPKLAKCTLHTFGSTGSSQVHDALCVLSLNVVNEKVFVFVWFWMVFLFVVGSFALIYRVVVLTQRWARILLLRASTRGSLPKSLAHRLTVGSSYGEWFVLRRLSMNVSLAVYRRLLLDLAEHYEADHRTHKHIS